MKLGLMPGCPATCGLLCVWSYKQDEAQGHSRDPVIRGLGGRSKDDPGEVYNG